MSGLGNIEFPLKMIFSPGAIASHIFGAEVNFTMLYGFMSVELFAATYFLSRTLHQAKRDSLIAGWLMSVLSVGFSPFRIGDLFSLTPIFAEHVAAAAVVLSLLLRIARRDSSARIKLVQDLVSCFLILAWVITVLPTFLILHIPFFTVATIFLTLFGKRSASPSTWKRIPLFWTGCGVIFGVFGFVPHVYGLFKFTAASDSTIHMFSDRQGELYFVSTLIFGTSFERIFSIIGLIGISLGARQSREMRYVAAITVTFLPLIWIYGWLNIVSANEIGPSGNYFEYTTFPILAIGTAVVTSRIWQFVSRILPRITHNALIVPMALFFMVSIWVMQTNDDAYKLSQVKHYPPERPALIALLEREIGMYSDPTFRGRAITVTRPLLNSKFSPSEPIWPSVHARDTFVLDGIGNDVRNTGLGYFGIPHVFDYSPLITPFYFKFATYFLAKKGEIQLRNVVMTQRVNLPILKMIGVNFIISDVEQADLRLRATQKVADNYILRLYEIDDVNLGTYSPTNVLIDEKLDGQFALMDKVGFDSKKDVVVSENISGSFVPASDARMSVIKGDVHITAKSSGTSLLVLPLEYSRCFDVDNRISNSKIELFRADTLLTGIKFDLTLDAVLTFRTGPFHNSTCRIQDFHEYQSIR